MSLFEGTFIPCHHIPLLVSRYLLSNIISSQRLVITYLSSYYAHSKNCFTIIFSGLGTLLSTALTDSLKLERMMSEVVAHIIGEYGSFLYIISESSLVPDVSTLSSI